MLNMNTATIQNAKQVTMRSISNLEDKEVHPYPQRTRATCCPLFIATALKTAFILLKCAHHDQSWLHKQAVKPCMTRLFGLSDYLQPARADV